MLRRKKTLARKLFVGLLMEATDDRVKDMHDVITEYNKNSPFVMTILRVVPFVDDSIELIRTEYKYRLKNKRK
jgi:hypothetical protein